MKTKKYGLVLALIAGILLFAGCTTEVTGGGASSSDNTIGGGSSSSQGNTPAQNNTFRERAALVTAGYSASYAFASSGEHWFKFVGTGETVIFETTGNVVDTYMQIYIEDQSSYSWYNDDDGEGNNALYSLDAASGVTYFIRITGGTGTYGFIVTTPTTNTRTNPISVAEEYSSHHIISFRGEHWFSFQGTGNSIVFETDGNVVNTSIALFIGNNTSAILTDNNKISFSTISGTTYYVRVTTRNNTSGTYTFNVRDGIGDGSSKSNSIPIIKGHSSSHTFIQSGQSERWFSFVGTGETVIFETTGNVVDTYMQVYIEDQSSYSWYNDDDGEGNNALYSLDAALGTIYFIRITGGTGTFGFAVTVPTTNTRTNPISVTAGYSSSHIISSGGEHWFSFQGTGNSVIFETETNAVNTSIALFIGDSTNAILIDNNKISFSTISGTTYYVRTTTRNSTSGTYTFNVRNGSGDGSSRSNSIPITKGYSSSHTFIQSGQSERWFSFVGTGETVIFETTGNVVDTYMQVYIEDQSSYSWYNDDDGEGNNALYSLDAASGTIYFIRITGGTGTFGFVVR